MSSADPESCQQEFYKGYQSDLTQIFKQAEAYADDDGESFTDSLIYQDLLELSKRYGHSSYLANGGMKSIEKTFDHKSDRKVAIARLQLDSSKEAVQGFLAEARLTAKLEHPNIVPVYDIGIDEEDGGKPYFTMKLIKGITLSDFLAEENDLTERLEILIKVCNAIAYAHSRKVIHLDLKPDNIQIGEFGEVLVIDWGLAKIIRKEDEVDPMAQTDTSFTDYASYGKHAFNATICGVVKGSPGYMAPEQLEPGSDLDERTDIFALGAILYKMLCGEGISNAKNLKEYVAHCLHSHFYKPSEKVPYKKQSIPEGLEAIAMKALSKDPAQRYQKIQEFEDELQTYMKGYSPSAQTTNPIIDLKLFYQRNKKFLQALMAILLMVFMAALLSYFTVTEESLARRKANTLYLEKANQNIKSFIANKQFNEAEKELLQVTEIVNNDHYLNNSDIMAPILKKPSAENKKNMKKYVLLMYKSYGDLYAAQNKWGLALENYLKAGDVRMINLAKEELKK